MHTLTVNKAPADTVRRESTARRSKAGQRGNSATSIFEAEKRKAIQEAERCIECGSCQDSCPIHMNVQQTVRAIRDDNLVEAVRCIYQSNPLARVCGRICSNFCEASCALGLNGKPVAIRKLVRYAIDTLGHEAVKEIAAENRARFSTGKRIAIIGSGPAGMTAAYDLVKKGHGVAVYESGKRPGGMMLSGVLASRVPQDRLDKDLDAIMSMGVDLRLNMKVGQDISMEKLRGNFDAVLVAGGLYRKHGHCVPGESQPDCVSAINLLCEIANGGGFAIPHRFRIIGTDNVSMYLAESLARRQQEEYGRVDTAVVMPLKSDSPAADAEWRGRAVSAGVKIIATDDIASADMKSADLVVEAIGQKPDISYLGETIALSLERQHSDALRHARTAAPEKWLWTVGDMVASPDIVQAIAAGHRAASDIHDTLMGIYRFTAA